jgi:hypothetical protein
MKKGTIFVHNKEVEYCIRKHRLAKRINLRLRDDGHITVTVPQWMPYKTGEYFMNSRKKWISQSLKELDEKTLDKPELTRKDYLNNKEQAAYFLYKKLEQFNYHYNFQYRRVCVKDQKSRWGSCSSKGNLNFSYKIVFLPEYLADYIVVHELCHLHELNHSPRFWKLVEQVIPDHKERRKALKKYRL